MPVLLGNLGASDSENMNMNLCMWNLVARKTAPRRSSSRDLSDGSRRALFVRRGNKPTNKRSGFEHK